MLVKISYHDNESLTKEEVVLKAQKHYGKGVDVKCLPDSTLAYDYINFGVSQLITHEQVGLMYDKGRDYHSELSGLRARTLAKLTEILDQVIIDNEARI